MYNCLPFGLRTSAFAFAKLTAVTAEALRRSAQQRCPHAEVVYRDSGDYYSSYSLRYCRLCGQLLG